MKTKTTATNRRRLDEKFTRVTTLCLLALMAALFQAREARAQWAASGNNVTNTNTGNVGIGTANPAYAKLQVTGGIRLDDDSGSATGSDTQSSAPFMYIGTTGGGNQFQYNAGGGLDLWQYNAGVWGRTLTFAKTGNVGIGTTTPSTAKLVISGTAGLTGLDMASTDQYAEMRVIRNSLNAGDKDLYLQWQAGAGSKVHLYSNNTETMTLNTGNVGIGTNNPGFLLDVAGSASTPLRVRDSSGREYISTGIRTGPVATWVWPVVSLSSGRLIVDSTSPDGGNDTIVRRVVNSMIFNPSDHPTLPGAFLVRQVGGAAALFIDQGANGNVGIGTTAPASKLHVAGNITVDGNINAKYQDVAEWVPTAQKLSAGMVVVVDAKGSNRVLASAAAYDTRVAGVISAQPGITLGEASENKALVATTGRVKVKVDATRLPIRAGDLLVTSDVEGVAMRSEPVSLGGIMIHRPGTIIGKALESLDKGTGEILVLLSLQ